MARTKEGQGELKNSPYGVYHKAIYGSAIPDDNLEYMGIEDTITSFIFIVASLGAGAAVWLEPSVINFQVHKSTEAFVVAMASLFNLISVTLLAAGFSGVFLNVFSWLRPR